MSFSCTIMAGDTDLTKYADGPIHCQLLCLGPNGEDDFDDAPFRVEDFRSVVHYCKYGDRLKDAAQDCFKELQRIAKANLDFLQPDKHCDSCTCEIPEKKPARWGANYLRAILSIDPKTITYIQGGW